MGLAVRLDDDESCGNQAFMKIEAGVITCDKEKIRFVHIGIDSDMWTGIVVLCRITTDIVRSVAI